MLWIILILLNILFKEDPMILMTLMAKNITVTMSGNLFKSIIEITMILIGRTMNTKDKR